MLSTASCHRLLQPANGCLSSLPASSKFVGCTGSKSLTRNYTTMKRGSQMICCFTSRSHISLMSVKRRQFFTNNLTSKRADGCFLNVSVVSTSMRHRFSQKVSSSSTSSVLPSASKSSQRWIYIARAIRYVRIPVLVVSVYSLGYQQGVIDCTKTPEAIQDQILASILLSSGIKNVGDSTEYKIINAKDVSIITAIRECDDSSYQVAVVAHRIIQSGQRYVQEQLDKAIKEVNDILPADINPKDANEVLNSNEVVQFWYHARLRIEGEHVKSKQWKYVIIQSPDPNAFVTEVLPHYLFITTAMLELATNSDELAFVLGHEVSHLILGHVSASNQLETTLRTIEILLLSLDPTSGFLSIIFISALYAIRKAISASYSRDNELQADELGLIIAARACFDTLSGVKVMYKLYKHNLGIAGNKGNKSHHPKLSDDVVDQSTLTTDTDVVTSSAAVAVQLMDTHPPTLERYQRLKMMVTDGAENYKKYSHCNGMTRIYNILSWSS